MRKYLWIGAISAAVLLCLSGCSNPEGGDGKDKEAAPVEIEAAASGYDPAWEQLFDETEISEAFREDLREFAFDSTAAASSKTDGNMVFSPLSLYYALSILGTGASGETEAEILEALGVRDKAELASQCGKLYRRYVYSQEQEKAIAGENGVAAYGVIMYVNFIFTAVYFGYAVGCAPIISYHFGADNHTELKNLFRKSLIITAVLGLAMMISSQILASPLAKIFVGYDAELFELTCHGFRIYALSFLLCGFNIFSSAFFTALNNGAVSAGIAFLRTLVFQLAAILILPGLLGIDGVWLAIVAAEILALTVSVYFFISRKKQYHYA